MFRSHWTIIREHVDPSHSYHLTLIFTLHFGASEACLYGVLGYVCIPLSMCPLRCCAWYCQYQVPSTVPSITAQDTHRQRNTDIT